MSVDYTFTLKMKIFETAYDGLAKNIDKNIFYAISIKLLIIRFSEFAKDYNTEEREYFNEILNAKLSYFNPDDFLKKMKNSLLCISFSKSSPLIDIYGENEICGKYLGLRSAQNTQIKNDEGILENKFAHIVFEIAYPTINDKFLVTSFDLKSSEVF